MFNQKQEDVVPETTKNDTPVTTRVVGEKPVKKRSAWSTVAFFFLMLFLLALAASGAQWYLWQQAQNNVTSTKADNTTLKFNLDQANQQIARLEGKTEQANADASTNDEALIKTAALNYNALLSKPLSNPTVTVSKKVDSQAIATVADAVSGYKAFVKKSASGTWYVVWSGQNTPPNDIVSQFNLTVTP